MVRSRGYLKSLDDFRAIPINVTETGTPVMLGDVARIQMGPEMRRGIAELDGEGEVVGGIVIMRSGRNALTTIAAVKKKLDSLKPAGANTSIVTSVPPLPSGADVTSSVSCCARCCLAPLV